MPTELNPFFVLNQASKLSDDRFQQRAIEELDDLERQAATVFGLAIKPLQEEIVNSASGAIPLETAVQISDLLSFTDSILKYLAETRPIVKQEIA